MSVDFMLGVFAGAMAMIIIFIAIAAFQMAVGRQVTREMRRLDAEFRRSKR